MNEFPLITLIYRWLVWGARNREERQSDVVDLPTVPIENEPIKMLNPAQF